MKYRAKLLTGAVVVILAGASSGAAIALHAHAQHREQVQTTAQQMPTSVSYKGVTGETALQALEAAHHVQTKDYSGFGPMVTGIDGRIADSQHFWAFYVDDKLASVGASSYQTKTGDSITWKYETE